MLLAVAGAVLLAEKVWYKRVGRGALAFALILSSLALGSLRYSVKDFHITDEFLETGVGERVEFEGLVVAEPEARDLSTRVLISCKHSVFTEVECGGERVLVTTDLYTYATYGDEVRVSGVIKKPGLIDDGAGRPFDYGKYLSKDDIYYTMSFAEVEVLSSGHGSRLKHLLFALKRSFVERAKSILPEPQSSLLAGLVVAGKESMPESVLEEFRRAGVVHIVVLSGYNITIIADFMRKMFERLLLFTRVGASPALATGASIVAIIFFVLMTGAQATVVRAAIMVLVVMAAKLFGRAYSAPRALVGAAFLMVLHNPKILVFDPSFQLSFLATSALIYVVPIVEKYLERVTDKWQLRTTLATTIGTQLTVLPLLIYLVGDVSLVSLPANVAVLLLIPYTMLAGFLATALSYISTLVAWPLAFVAHMFLSWILWVSHVLGNLSFASVAVDLFPVWGVVLSYIALVTLVRLFGNSLHKIAS